MTDHEKAQLTFYLEKHGGIGGWTGNTDLDDWLAHRGPGMPPGQDVYEATLETAKTYIEGYKKGWSDHRAALDVAPPTPREGWSAAI